MLYTTAGDFNAWAKDWDRILLDTFSRLDLVLLNNGDTSTFRWGGISSISDLTFVSSNLFKSISWHISEDNTHSYHQAIEFTIHDKLEANSRSMVKVQRWAKEKLDADTMVETTRSSTTDLDKQIGSALKTACDGSIPAKRTSNRRKENYWRNSNIAALWKEYLKARRQFQRHWNRSDFLERREAFHQARRDRQKANRNTLKKFAMELIQTHGATLIAWLCHNSEEGSLKILLVQYS